MRYEKLRLQLSTIRNAQRAQLQREHSRTLRQIEAEAESSKRQLEEEQLTQRDTLHAVHASNLQEQTQILRDQRACEETRRLSMRTAKETLELQCDRRVVEQKRRALAERVWMTKVTEHDVVALALMEAREMESWGESAVESYEPSGF
jgi:hypothetical protein